MTGPEHFAEAERIAQQAAELQARRAAQGTDSALRLAELHAYQARTLAIIAAAQIRAGTSTGGQWQ